MTNSDELSPRSDPSERRCTKCNMRIHDIRHTPFVCLQTQIDQLRAATVREKDDGK